ncbi:MAG TPA: tripartite tricarboxylate transporter substrate binding protein, partial [Albitalea sp.]|nr:tripartite tricarboxylate transporter substrate binding protein [Albitalea sp.]
MNHLHSTRRRALALAIAAAGATLGSGVLAQGYPAKPVTFVVPFAAGSATDQLARALGQSVSADTKQAVIVD